jgi:cysteinyl-tRNA synthetase
MDDDLNTVGAIGLIFEKVKEMNRVLDLHGDRLDDVSLNQLKNDRHNLFIATRVLGLLEENPEDFFRKLSKSSESTDVGEVERMIQERSRARAEKDWAQADVLRDRLQEMGIVLEDGAQGTTWRFDV